MTRHTPRCILLEGRPAVVPALEALVDSVGIQVVDHAGTFPAGVALVLREQPDLVIVELALTGLSGLPALRTLHQAAAGCAIVVLSPFTGLAAAAQEVGALSLCDDRDLADLAKVLSGWAQSPSATGKVSTNPSS